LSRQHDDAARRREENDREYRQSDVIRDIARNNFFQLNSNLKINVILPLTAGGIIRAIVQFCVWRAAAMDGICSGAICDCDFVRTGPRRATTMGTAAARSSSPGGGLFRRAHEPPARAWWCR